jgi:hypothetical protein
VVASLKDDRVFPLAGQLEAISGRTIAVDTHRGQAAARVDGETVYRIPDVEEPELADLSVGQRVAIRGTLNADGVLSARIVAVPHARPQRRRAQGLVLAVEGEGFILRVAPDRRFSVRTDGETLFRIPGVENPSIADLEAGDRVAGEGVVDEGGFRATLILVLPEHVARLGGDVIGVDGGRLAVQTLGGQVDVLTGSDTVYRIAGLEGAALGDIAAGDRVFLAGVWQDSTTFDALIVAVSAERRPGSQGAVRGRVIQVERDNLIVGTQHGPLRVVAAGNARYRVPGAEAAGLADVRPGALVFIQGTWHEGGTLHASVIAVLDLRQDVPR